MSHPRLNNPRTYRAKLTAAARVKRAPRHGFRADRAVEALFSELNARAARPVYQGGSADVALVSTRCGRNIWCRDGKFIWSDVLGFTITHPASDASGAATLLQGPLFRYTTVPATTGVPQRHRRHQPYRLSAA
ncbi:hypothetical protein [Nocardiopsis ansamitocini]|uniref:Uncharacterized protein n=1 Tax=Nocardiopsis ansamitocini TaxID=1670832 RepID=A0A9W6UIQ9_9ACTN|nr:hypothetical protein [Nocardiopsis ansamitocini]GLU47300.1 hypothetical protein Nans01_16510 [Nocardiopsis ansamitocini]